MYYFDHGDRILRVSARPGAVEFNIHSHSWPDFDVCQEEELIALKIALTKALEIPGGYFETAERLLRSWLSGKYVDVETKAFLDKFSPSGSSGGGGA